MLADVVDLLRCPSCESPLRLDGAVRCDRGHSFDVARAGYVNLMDSPPPGSADTAAMVAARVRFLSSGHYRPLADALTALAAASVAGASPAVAEAGVGTGYYLAAVLAAYPGGRGLGWDASPAAARRAARAGPRLGIVVADSRRRLPIAGGSLTALLTVFSPRTPAEAARILADDGVWVVAVPTGDHLAELRSALGLLGVEPEKERRLLEQTAPWFSLRRRVPVRATFRPDRSALLDLVAMGPNAFHTTADRLAASVAGLPDGLALTLAVDLHLLRRR